MSARTMTLLLLDGRTATELPTVSSLIAQDASGQFGILPGHADLVTVLEPGLFRYRTGSDPTWAYGASAGGLLRCEPEADCTRVSLVSRRFLLGSDPEDLQAQVDALLAHEASLRMSTRDNVAQLDQSMYQRMQRLAQMARVTS